MHRGFSCLDILAIMVAELSVTERYFYVLFTFYTIFLPESVSVTTLFAISLCNLSLSGIFLKLLLFGNKSFFKSLSLVSIGSDYSIPLGFARFNTLVTVFREHPRFSPMLVGLNPMPLSLRISLYWIIILTSQVKFVPFGYI